MTDLRSPQSSPYDGTPVSPLPFSSHFRTYTLHQLPMRCDPFNGERWDCRRYQIPVLGSLPRSGCSVGCQWHAPLSSTQSARLTRFARPCRGRRATHAGGAAATRRREPAGQLTPPESPVTSATHTHGGRGGPCRQRAAAAKVGPAAAAEGPPARWVRRRLSRVERRVMRRPVGRPSEEAVSTPARPRIGGQWFVPDN